MVKSVDHNFVFNYSINSFRNIIIFYIRIKKDVYRLNSHREEVISNGHLKGLTLCQ